MSENDYVATAAAEKRLREVLSARMQYHTEALVEEIAVLLLDGAQIEYKSRAKQVVISLDLPDKATVDAARGQLAATAASAESQAIIESETSQAPPSPRIVPFEPKQFAEPDFEDVHFD